MMMDRRVGANIHLFALPPGSLVGPEDDNIKNAQG